MDLSKQIDGFELKLRQLASQIDRQRAEKEEVVAENTRLKRELDRQSGVVSALKEKLEAATHSMSAAITTEATPEGSGERKAPAANNGQLRSEIDFCLKEIDKCIEWLQRQ